MRIQVKLDPIDVPIVLPNVLFALAKWDLTPESMASLDTVVKTLELNPTLVVELRSHTDYRDTDEKNDILSQHRADTCVKYLISKGIAKDRLVARGMGEKEPRIIDEDYKNKKYYKYDEFDVGTELTESYIKRQSSARQEIANQINRRTDVKVLRDDYVPNGPAVAPGGEKEKPEEEAKPVGEFYTCEARDSFGKIAKVNKISVVDLKKLNGGLRGVRVFEGMMLKITPDGDYTEWDAEHYHVQLGDNLDKISKALGMSEKDLRDLNDGIKDKDLMPGMWLLAK
jgi:peptidoglycan-associated lipoprotein